MAELDLVLDTDPAQVADNGKPMPLPGETPETEAEKPEPEAESKQPESAE